MGIIAEARKDLEGWIQEVGLACSEVGGDVSVQTLAEALDEAVADPRIRIVVCGEWNTGKSSLINALLGQPDLLPVDVNPCSSYITVVEHSAQPVFYVRRRGVEEPLTDETFLSLTAAQAQDPDIELLRVGSPNMWPGEEVVLVDTPGLEDLDQTRAEVTLGYIPSADVVLLVLAAPTGPRGTERAFVRNHLTSREIRRVIVVLNKIDLLNESEDVQRLADHTRRSLADLLPDSPIVPLSACTWISAREGDRGWLDHTGGIAALRAEILKVVRRERLTIIRRRFYLPARQWLDEIRLRVKAEEAALGQTLAETEQTVARHRKQAAEMMAKVDDLFNEAKKKIRAGLTPWLEGVPQRLDQMVQNILAEVEDLPDLAAVRSYVNDRVLERRVAVEFRSLCHELETHMLETVRTLDKEDWVSGLQMPFPEEVSARLTVPEVQSLLLHVPEFVINIFEAILLNPLFPGGLITAILARLGLDKLLKGIPIIRPILPANFLKNHLVSAIRTSLAHVQEQAESAIRDAAEDAMKDMFAQIRSQLDRKITAVEAGLEDARIALSREKAIVESRKADLARVLTRLDWLASRLESLVSVGG